MLQAGAECSILRCSLHGHPESSEIFAELVIPSVHLHLFHKSGILLKLLQESTVQVQSQKDGLCYRGLLGMNIPCSNSKIKTTLLWEAGLEYGITLFHGQTVRSTWILLYGLNGLEFLLSV